MKNLYIKVREFIEKNFKIILIFIFLFGVAVYVFLASKMTSPFYFTLDEELYIDMARSYFYTGGFSRFYEVLNYSCVLYSMVISVAYFFYSPENILFLMRIIGVILMISSVFPIYLLSKEVLKSKAKALGMALVSLLIPELMATLYLIQEVLCYPMFLWICYIVYLRFTRGEHKKYDIILSILFAIIFFVKSYAIAFGIAYYFTLFILALKNKEYKQIKNIFLYGILVLIIIAIGYLLIYTLNGFISGSNHYDNQIGSIFPITIDKILTALYGIFFYSVFTLFCMGFLPVFIPVFRTRYYKENDKRFILFIVLSTIFTIVEVAAIVFIPEDSGRIYPDKVCFRYLVPLLVPYMVMMLKCKKEDVKITKGIVAVFVISFAYLVWYYIGQGIQTPEIDAFMLAIIQILNVKIHNFNTYFIIIVTEFTTVLLILCILKKIANIKAMYIKLFIVVTIILFPLNYYMNITFISNKIYKGEELKPEFVKVANFIKQDYDKVYLINVSSPARAVYGYLQCDYKPIGLGAESNIDISNEKIAVIVPSEYNVLIEGANQVDLEIEKLKVYISDREFDSLHIKLNY